MGGMPEMETNRVKTKQVALASREGAKGLLISQVSFLHIAIWWGARNARRPRQKGSPQKETERSNGHCFLDPRWSTAQCTMAGG